jgi:anti-sigma B factor antagonist
MEVDKSLEVEITRLDEWTLRLVARGDLDLASAPYFRRVATRALGEEPTKIEVDLSDVQFIDSAGLGQLVSLARRARRGGCRVDLLDPAGRHRRLFACVGLPDLLRGVAALEASTEPEPTRSGRGGGY